MTDDCLTILHVRCMYTSDHPHPHPVRGISIAALFFSTLPYSTCYSLLLFLLHDFTSFLLLPLVSHPLFLFFHPCFPYTPPWLLSFYSFPHSRPIRSLLPFHFSTSFTSFTSFTNSLGLFNPLHICPPCPLSSSSLSPLLILPCPCPVLLPCLGFLQPGAFCTHQTTFFVTSPLQQTYTSTSTNEPLLIESQSTYPPSCTVRLLIVAVLTRSFFLSPSFLTFSLTTRLNHHQQQTTAVNIQYHHQAPTKTNKQTNKQTNTTTTTTTDRIVHLFASLFFVASNSRATFLFSLFNPLSSLLYPFLNSQPGQPTLSPYNKLQPSTRIPSILHSLTHHRNPFPPYLTLLHSSLFLLAFSLFLSCRSFSPSLSIYLSLSLPCEPTTRTSTTSLSLLGILHPISRYPLLLSSPSLTPSVILQKKKERSPLDVHRTHAYIQQKTPPATTGFYPHNFTFFLRFRQFAEKKTTKRHPP
ncbi:hypothetical protein BKA57DRAFT_62927 [Linnemannia elongata]|nr:hypothetical protein BKA57DRAFT_62927 [Linnemannia elongata]